MHLDKSALFQRQCTHCGYVRQACDADHRKHRCPSCGLAYIEQTTARPVARTAAVAVPV